MNERQTHRAGEKQSRKVTYEPVICSAKGHHRELFLTEKLTKALCETSALNILPL